MTNNANDSVLDWRTYFARFGPRLVLFARQWLPEVSDAEDAVQEAFIRFWRKHQAPNDEHAGLLFAAVRTAALDQIRRETRRKRREVIASDEELLTAQHSETAPLFEPSQAHMTASVEAALSQLPAEQREVLVLKVWGELTFAQIGQALELSANTAASRYRYSINALKKILRPIHHE